jgi:oleate hydratase
MTMSTKSKAYLAGSGIGSLAAAAAFIIIRDGNQPGEHISILQATPMIGGNLDGAGDLAGRYSTAVTC